MEDFRGLKLGLRWDNGSEYRTHIEALFKDVGLGKPDAKINTGLTLKHELT